MKHSLKIISLTFCFFIVLLLAVEGFFPPKVFAQSQSSDLPSGWREWQTPDGRTYYQRPNGSTTWIPPRQSPPADFYPPPPPPRAWRGYGGYEGMNSRRGFFLGLGMGGGSMSVSGSGLSETRGAFLFDGKIGGGISNNILLMYDGTVNYGQFDGVGFTVSTDLLAVQWFVTDNFYIRPGFGLSTVSVSANVDGTNVGVSSDVSYAAQVAAGYEFRYGRYFGLSPEFIYRYAHISSNISDGNANIIGVQLATMFYF